MRPAEMADLLNFISATDGRNLTPQMPHAWMEHIGDLDYADAKDAVRHHFRSSTEWLMPAHIANRVEAVRRRRIAAASPIEVNAADSGDVAHELETRKRLIDAIAAGRMTKHQFMAYKAGNEPLETLSGAHQLTTTRTHSQ